MDIFKEFKKDFPNIEREVSLKNYTTFNIGGNAKYFLRTSDKNELINIIKKANILGVKFCVIGGGSNILFSDDGFDGLVISFKIENINKEKYSIEKKEKDNVFLINVDASIPLYLLILQLKSFSGMEWAAGIPGTIGGAINGNAGAFGESMSDFVENVKVLEINNNSIEERIFKNKDCDFSYRSSIFKKNNNLIIVSAELKLFEGKEKEIQNKIKNNLEKRKNKMPKGFSVGSIFKNYYGKIEESIIKKYPELRLFNEKGIIPAGILIEISGMKGKKIGDIKISEEHANIIVNLGNGKSKDVLDLINLIKKSVKEKFFVELEEEIKIFCD